MLGPLNVIEDKMPRHRFNTSLEDALQNAKCSYVTVGFGGTKHKLMNCRYLVTEEGCQLPLVNSFNFHYTDNHILTVMCTMSL